MERERWRGIERGMERERWREKERVRAMERDREMERVMEEGLKERERGRER